METAEAAQAIYEDELEGGERSASQLANDIQRRAEELCQVEIDGSRDDVHDEVTDLVEHEEEKEVAQRLKEAAGDIRSALGDHAPVMKELPGEVAGQAELDSSAMWVDPNSIQSDGDRIIDRQVAQNIGDHEAEHQKQSAETDVDTIHVGTQEFDEREVREAAAISVQSRRDFLFAEYQAITNTLPMNEADRQLVRAGKFRELERRKNGEQLATAA